MTDWTAGYVADIEYQGGFYRELGPQHIDLVCLICGVEPAVGARGYDYCELGCGQGTTLLLLAAANPRGRFVGVDFNPAHVARARDRAREAGLANVRFIEASFDDLIACRDLPDFDMVTAHGVYTWVSRENQQAIVRFLGTKLKPGGAALVSYNALPGWAHLVPLQRLIFEAAHLQPGRSDNRVESALDFVRQMQAAGPRWLDADEMMARLDDVRTGNISYLAHEYMNVNWRPLFHADVARDMAEAKLGFVGAGMILENYPALALDKKARELLDTVAVPDVRETVRDYFLSRTFRKDVFVRGVRRMSSERTRERLRELGLALLIPPDVVRFEVEVPLGAARLEERQYRPIVEALADGPKRIGDLLDLPELRGKAANDPVEVVGMLAGSAQATVCALPVEVAPAALRLNRLNVSEAVFADHGRGVALASAVGTAIHAGPMEMLVLDALYSDVPAELEAMTAHLWRRMASANRLLTNKGELLKTEAENVAALRDGVAQILRTVLPLWRSLGTA